mmetsp:Transcript_65569/g.116705  ORF Transcript_65569/g.116705 Transcript_65569/m.116705 type:complete len:86 (+) Transcript_65569:344-601(+)
MAEMILWWRAVQGAYATCVDTSYKPTALQLWHSLLIDHNLQRGNHQPMTSQDLSDVHTKYQASPRHYLAVSAAGPASACISAFAT